MNLTQHPEYQKYLSDQDAALAVQALLIPWAAVNEMARDALKTAVFQLTALFQEYNQVMWHDFPFPLAPLHNQFSQQIDLFMCSINA